MAANHLTTDLDDTLGQLSIDRTLKTAFTSKTLTTFWISVEGESPQLPKATIYVLTPLGSTYLCEKSFSALTNITNKYRLRQNMEDDLWGKDDL